MPVPAVDPTMEASVRPDYPKQTPLHSALARTLWSTGTAVAGHGTRRSQGGRRRGNDECPGLRALE